MKRFLFPLAVLFSTACSQEAKTSYIVSQVKEEEADFRIRKPFKVEKLVKKLFRDPTTQKKEECEDWAVSKEEAADIINSSEAISQHEWHYQFDHMACVMNGKLKQNNIEFDVEINAGSWLKISSQDTVLYFGSFNKEYEKLFLSSAYKPEDEEE